MNDETGHPGEPGDNQPPSTPPTPPSPPPAGTAPPPPGPGAPPPPASGTVEGNSDARMWGMLCHLLALIGLIVPFCNFLVPLIVWQVKKNEFAFVDDQGKESLNFQITIAIIGVSLFVLSWIPLVFCITVPLGILLLIPWIVFTIIGGLKANEGIAYRYPWTLRLIK